MATTLYDPAAGWKSYVLQARTDAAGSVVDDAGGEDLRTVLDAFYTEGVAEADAFQVLEDSPTGMTVLIGSGTAKADHAVIDGDISGQGAYLVRMEDATVTLTVPAADLSNPRIDEVYVIVQDNAYDSSSRVLPRIAYRDGTAATSPSAPGPDAAWEAYLLVATIAVAAGETEITNAEITDERVFTTSDVDVAVDQVATASIQDDAVSTAKIGPAAVGTTELANDAVTSAKILNQTITTVDILQDGVNGNRLVPASVDATRLAGAFLGSFEVSASATPADFGALSGTHQIVASVTLSIPASWGSWECFAHASYANSTNGFANQYGHITKIRIDGTDGPEKKIDVVFNTGDEAVDLDGSIAWHRTGMTTTGNRTVALMARTPSSGEMNDLFIYARAVRTS